MRLKAFAKINLGLDVVRKREDGYHEVRMIMQTVDIFDRLEMEVTDGDKITISSNLSFLPNDGNNLCHKAAKLLFDEFGIKKGLNINLEKKIPVAAGMAGGSSDAAAVLVGVNKLFGLKLSMQELMDRGVKIGADVPYCVMRGTALSEGIGEILTPLSPMPHCYIVVAKPKINVSTRFVYENLRLDIIEKHPDIDGMTEAIKNGNLAGVAERLSNVLETVTVREYPVIEEIKTFLKDMGAMNALMSGSGPTVFGIYGDRMSAYEAVMKLRKTGLAKTVILTEPRNFN